MHRIILTIVLSMLCAGAEAQTFVTSPFYQKSDVEPKNPHISMQGTVNGIPVTFAIVTSPSNYAPWSEGFQVEGAEKGGVIHWIFIDTRKHVAFGYDVVFHSIDGSNKVTCTFRPRTIPSPHPLAIFEESLPFANVEPDLPPLTVAPGEFVVVKMSPSADTNEQIIQYIHIEQSVSVKPN